jgi:hypothetical protein
MNYKHVPRRNLNDDQCLSLNAQAYYVGIDVDKITDFEHP